MRKAFFLVCFSLCFASLVFAKIDAKDYQEAINLFQSHKYNEAIEILQASIKQDPDQPFLFNLLGLIYAEQGESITSAEGSFEQAIRLDPNFADAYFNLASLYAKEGARPDLAAKYFEKTLKADPTYAKAYFGLGWFTLTSSHEAEKAAGYFKQTLEAFPEFSEAYYGLGLAYVQMGKAPLALESVSKLRNLGREDLASYLEMAIRGGELAPGFQEENSESGPAMQNTASFQESSGGEAQSSFDAPAPPSGKRPMAPAQPVSRESSQQDSSRSNSNPFQLH